MTKQTLVAEINAIKEKFYYLNNENSCFRILKLCKTNIKNRANV